EPRACEFDIYDRSQRGVDQDVSAVGLRVILRQAEFHFAGEAMLVGKILLHQRQAVVDPLRCVLLARLQRSAGCPCPQRTSVIQYSLGLFRGWPTYLQLS